MDDSSVQKPDMACRIPRKKSYKGKSRYRRHLRWLPEIIALLSFGAYIYLDVSSPEIDLSPSWPPGQLRSSLAQIMEKTAKERSQLVEARTIFYKNTINAPGRKKLEVIQDIFNLEKLEFEYFSVAHAIQPYIAGMLHPFVKKSTIFLMWSIEPPLRKESIRLASDVITEFPIVFSCQENAKKNMDIITKGLESDNPKFVADAYMLMTNSILEIAGKVKEDPLLKCDEAAIALTNNAGALEKVYPTLEETMAKYGEQWNTLIKGVKFALIAILAIAANASRRKWLKFAADLVRG